MRFIQSYSISTGRSENELTPYTICVRKYEAIVRLSENCYDNSAHSLIYAFAFKLLSYLISSFSISFNIRIHAMTNNNE